MNNKTQKINKIVFLSVAVCGVLMAGVSYAATSSSVMLNPASGTPGSAFTVTGSGFSPSEMVTLGFDNATSTANADINGGFAVMLNISTSTVSTSTPDVLTATGVTSGFMSSSTFTVVPPAAPRMSSSIMLSPTSGLSGSGFVVMGSGFSPFENVTLMLNGMTSTIPADTNGNFSITFIAPTSSSSIATPFSVTASGNVSGAMASSTFMVEPNVDTGVSSSTLSAFETEIQNEISQLQALITTLENEITADLGSGTGSSGSSTYPGTTLTGTIDAAGSVRTGTSIDFTGRNWGANEQVQVSNNGSVVTTAQADGGGNFSTGSLPVTAAPGQQTYTFTGMTSGLTRSVTVTVTQ